MPSKAQEVKDYLDVREVNGYSVQYTTFHAAHPISLEFCCMVYIGMPDNPQFLGALDPQDVAERIIQSVGPSGENLEYLSNLQKALDDLSIESGDTHIDDLARRVKDIRFARANQSQGTGQE